MNKPNDKKLKLCKIHVVKLKENSKLEEEIKKIYI